MLQTTSDNFKHICFVDMWDLGSAFGWKMSKSKVIFG